MCPLRRSLSIFLCLHSTTFPFSFSLVRVVCRSLFFLCYFILFLLRILSLLSSFLSVLLLFPLPRPLPFPLSHLDRDARALSSSFASVLTVSWPPPLREPFPWRVSAGLGSGCLPPITLGHSDGERLLSSCKTTSYLPPTFPPSPPHMSSLLPINRGVWSLRSLRHLAWQIKVFCHRRWCPYVDITLICDRSRGLPSYHRLHIFVLSPSMSIHLLLHYRRLVTMYTHYSCFNMCCSPWQS